MNESMLGGNDPSLVDSGLDKSAGTLLREAREAAGWHVGTLAASLKVPIKKLEALEADDLSQLPDAVFARALAATVCRTLHIDPGPVLARLPRVHTAALQVGSQETPIRLDNRSAGFRAPGFGGLPRWVLYLTGFLVLAAIVVGMLPSWGIGGDDALMDPATGLSESAAVPQPAMASTGPGAAVAPTVVTDVSPAALASQTPAALTASQGAASSAAVAAPAANVGATDTSATAVFTTREPSWVQIVDAAGVVLVRKTMALGETARVQGQWPLSVVIGRANAVEVTVRGKPFDLAAVSKDNVSRFQIK